MKQPTSTKARKQRKWRLKAPLHTKRKMLSSNLTKELREKYNRSSISIRKGDVVTIKRGTFKGESGEVTRVDMKKLKINVEGVTIKKADGSETGRSIDPSNVQIKELFIDDKKRRDLLERKIGE